MKISTPLRSALVLAVVACAGCVTRSISNSGYVAPYRYGAAPSTDYRGELSELDVVGVPTDTPISEVQIADALQSSARPRLDRTSRVLLVQSGADFSRSSDAGSRGRAL